MPALSAYKTELDYSYAPGIFPSMECLLHRPDRVRRLLVHSGSRERPREGLERLLGMAADLGIRIEEADRALSRISGKENCYAAAVFEKFQDTLYPACPHVMLHCPGDTGNVGTILRTALGFGIEDVALIRPCADLFDPKTVRASMPAPSGLGCSASGKRSGLLCRGVKRSMSWAPLPCATCLMAS